MFRSKIYKRIMDAISKKVDELENDFDAKKEALEAQLEKDIEEYADSLVQSVLGKIL